MRYSAFYDRRLGTIEGLFTIQETDHNGTTDKVFERLHSRSGQRRFANSDWVRGGSPIPYTLAIPKERPYWLWTHSLGRDTLAGATGIGEFFPISTGDEPAIIQGDGNRKREAVGLHGENQWPGSAGCIVIVRERDFLRVRDYLRQLNTVGIRRIPLIVL